MCFINLLSYQAFITTTRVLHVLGSVQVLRQRISEIIEGLESRPPTPLYFADVILEHVVWVSILVRGLFPMLFMIVLGTKITIRLQNDT